MPEDGATAYPANFVLQWPILSSGMIVSKKFCVLVS